MTRTSRTSAGSPPGASLLELLVALGCTSLLAAAVLPLVTGSAELGRDRLQRLDAGSAAAAAAAAVAADLARIGVGLEGASAARLQGSPIPLVETGPAGELRLLLALGEAVEIAGAWPTGPYRATGAGELVPGVRVVAVGSAGATHGEPVPMGRVVDVRPDGLGDVQVLVAWAGPESAYLAVAGTPRGLVPVEQREYGTTPAAGGTGELWRRDAGGIRQPVADGVTGFRVGFYLDLDGDGIGEDGPKWAFSSAAGFTSSPGSLRAVVVSVATTRSPTLLDAGPGEQATIWVGVDV